MKTEKIYLRFGSITAIILLAAMSRLLPHPPNFSPVGGLALFGAAYFSKRYWAYFIPIISMWLSDLILNNIVYEAYFDKFVWLYSGSLFTYGAFALIVLLGSFTLRKIRVSRLLVSAMGASLLFFIVSNFGVWQSSGLYPHTLKGITDCYVAAIPFFKNTVLGDLAYTSLLFGVFELAQKMIPQLRLNEAFSRR